MLYAIDVSGSMQAETETKVKDHLLRNANLSDPVVLFDDRLVGTMTVGAFTYGPHKVLGRGGTAIRPVIDFRDKHAPGEKLVVISDGMICDLDGKTRIPNSALIGIGMGTDIHPNFLRRLEASFDSVEVL